MSSQFLSNSSALQKLPNLFSFGVATADHQCESYIDDLRDIQDVWERERKLTLRQSATDFWNRYSEDIDLAKGMGCKMFRISLAWSRLEPSEGNYSDTAFSHYRDLIIAIRAAGMQPIVTLHHYTWPLHIENRGGSIDRDFPEIFRQYVEQVVLRLGDLVEYWVTFNEPNQLIYGYFKAGDYHLPPGNPPGTSVAKQMDQVKRLIPNLFIANKLARQTIQAKYPTAKIGANPFLLGLPPLSRWFVDWQVTNLKSINWEKQGYRYTEQSILWPRDVDIVVGMLTRTKERQGIIDFSEDYFIDGLQLLVRRQTNFTSLNDLNGQAIAIVRGSTQEDALREYLPNSLSRLVNHYEEGINLLETGAVAAVLADKVRLLSTIKKSDKFQLLGDILVPQKYAVGVAKGNPQLLDIVNCAVREFRESNNFDKSFDEYLSTLAAKKPDMSNTRRYVDVSTSTDIEREPGKIDENLYVNNDANSWLGKIRKRGYLVAAVRSNIPGMGFKNPKNDEYEGLEINLVRQIATLIFGNPSKVQFKSVRSRQRISSLRSPLQIFDPLLRSISVLSSVFNSNWWNLGMAGKLPSFLCPADCIGQLDYVGLDYYWGSKSLLPGPVLKLIKASQGVYSKAPVWSQGLYSLLKQHARLFPGMEIIVVENGCVDQASNIKREEYIEEHVQQLVRAHQDGVPIKAYVCWSITSNREWGLRFGPDSDFGLFHIDLDTDSSLKRHPTSASNAYKNIIDRHTSL